MATSDMKASQEHQKALKYQTNRHNIRSLSDLPPVMDPPRASTRKLTRKSVLMGLSGLLSGLEGLEGLMLAVILLTGGVGH